MALRAAVIKTANPIHISKNLVCALMLLSLKIYHSGMGFDCQAEHLILVIERLG